MEAQCENQPNTERKPKRMFANLRALFTRAVARGYWKWRSHAYDLQIKPSCWKRNPSERHSDRQKFSGL
jgi:hypothetical protein